MAKSRLRFHTKLKILLFFCCALALTFTLAVNLILALNKRKITGSLNQISPEPIGIENIFFLPPNFIILRNLYLSESKIHPEKRLLNIGLSYSSFSLSGFLGERSLRIRSFRGTDITIDPQGFLSFLKDNFTRILDLITSLPQQDFNLSLYPKGAGNNLRLKLKKQVFSASGSLGKNIFSFDGMVSKKGINVEKFKLSTDSFDCQFWGKLNPNLAEIKGFILTPDRVKKTNQAGLFILDIDSRLKFSFPLIEIEHLNFSVNNNPVKITGRLNLAEPFSCGLQLFSDFRSMDNQESRLKKISLSAEFSLEKEKIAKAGVQLNIDFPEYKPGCLPLEKLRINVEGLTLNLGEPQALKLNIPRLNLFAKTSANPYEVNLEDLNSRIDHLGGDTNKASFSSRFYGGQLQGQAKIEMKDFLPVISADIRIKDVDANKLDNLLIHFSKVYGKLTAQLSFVNYPQLIGKGSAHIDAGYLNNFEFLKWLARLFGLDSLKKVNFDTASTDFVIDKDGAGMYGMNLNSKNLKITGDFKLKEADMVSSTISISLHRRLLQESAKFNTLLNLLGTKQDLVKFNFQLSGNLHNMNFQWLKSDFKDDLQRAIPDFAERRLERKLEGIIESITEE